MSPLTEDRIRFVTNIKLTAGTDGLDIDFAPDSADLRPAALMRRSADADAIVMKLPGKRTAFASLLAKVRHGRPVLVYYDVLIPTISNWWERPKRRAYLDLVRQADIILTVHRDTAEYARLLRLPQERLRYIGFKSNVWEDHAAVERGKVTQGSGEYVLACGRSYRDFRTFTEAMALAGVPARILMTQGRLEPHGSIPPPPNLPPNVELVQHDGTRAAWVEALLRARIVVVPMRGDVINASVSVPLEAMNLSRPVIITEGPATRLMLNGATAGIVPPSDSHALAREALRLWHDHELRVSRVEEARAYVETLGGVDRMSRDIVRETLSLLERRPARLAVKNRRTDDRGVLP